MSGLRRRLAEQEGHTIVELMVVASLSIVVLLAVLGALDTFQRTAARNAKLNDSQDRTRQTLAKLARELRNLASPTPEQPQALDKATGYDLVFQTVDHIGPNAGANTANVRRVRYCLDNSTAGTGQNLWTQSQRWTSAATPPVPSTTACPDSAWSEQSVVARGVTNRTQSRDRPLFTFNSTTLTSISVCCAQPYTIASSFDTVAFGEPGDVPVAGDWNGDGEDDLGVFRPGFQGTFLLRVPQAACSFCFPPIVFSFIALFAITNTALLNYIMGSRLVYGMARQGLVPAPLGAVHPARSVADPSECVSSARSVRDSSSPSSSLATVVYDRSSYDWIRILPALRPAPMVSEP